MAQFVILLTYYAALSIDTGIMIDFGLKDLGMGIFLVLVNLSICFLSLWLGWERLQRYRDSEELLQAKANLIENAAGFTQDKFSTTFEAISQTSVSSSHILVFHYTTLRLAKLGRESGVPALENHGSCCMRSCPRYIFVHSFVCVCKLHTRIQVVWCSPFDTRTS